MLLRRFFYLRQNEFKKPESILSTFCPPRARNALLFRVARNKRVFALVRDTSKAQFVTRSHSNSESHARARPPESLPNEASVVMMRRVRVGFLYVTLRLNAAAFSKSVRFLFSLVLFFVLIYLYSLHLSSRPRTFLIGAPAQESISKVRFCASFALGRPRERKKSLVLIVLVRKTHEIISRFLFFVSLFFPPFREFHRRNELGTNQRDLFNDWHLLPNEVHQFLSVFRYTRARGTGGEIRAGRSILRYISRSFFYVLCGVFSSSVLRVSAQQESFCFVQGKFKYLPQKELFVVCYNDVRTTHKGSRRLLGRRDENAEDGGQSERLCGMWS